MPELLARAEDQAEPLRLPPLSDVDVAPRCWRCSKLLTRYFLARPWKLDCPRCHAKNASAPAPSS